MVTITRLNSPFQNCAVVCPLKCVSDSGTSLLMVMLKHERFRRTRFNNQANVSTNAESALISSGVRTSLRHSGGVPSQTF